MNVLVWGRSKVGENISRALRRRGHRATLRPHRRGLPRRPITAPLLLLAIRDDEIAPLAEKLALRRLVSSRTVVLHVAGRFGAEVLSPLAGTAAGIGQAHPLISFASASATPTLKGAHLLVSGDRAGVRGGRALARALEMTPRIWPEVDRATYHAAAGLVANGAAALAAAGAALLRCAGARQEEAAAALGPLLRSVAENVTNVGLPAALTGPVRRGDIHALRVHLSAVEKCDRELVPLYLALARAQLPLARALGDASPAALDELEGLLQPRRSVRPQGGDRKLGRGRR